MKYGLPFLTLLGLLLAHLPAFGQQVTMPTRPIPPKTAQPPGAFKPAATIPGPSTAPPNPNGAAMTKPGAPKPAVKSEGTVDDEGVTVQFGGVPVREVMDLYQRLTDKLYIVDPQLENAQVVIDTPGKLSKQDALEFIEKSLFINGYAIVPSGDKMVKVLAVGMGKNFAPESDGKIILDASKLPNSDQAVSFLLPLNNMKAEDAAQEFSQIMQGHSYAKITPVPNAKALVIYENSATIRAIIDLAKQIDVGPTATITKRIFLERADAEEVAQAISSIMGLDSTGSGSGTGSAPRPVNTAPVNAARAPGAAPAGGAAQGGGAVVYGSGGGAQAEGPQAKVISIPRQNAIMAIASPSDLKRIESLIEEFDAESPVRGFITRKVRFLDVTEFVDAGSKALMRGSSDKGGGGSSGLASQTNSSTSRVGTTDNNRSSSFSGLSGLNSGLGGYGGGLGGYGGGFGGMGGGLSGGGSSLQETQMPKMQSVLIGKTLVIVDPPNSSIYASGPPEQLKMLDELITQMDKRPPQIHLSAIIGEFTIGNDFSFGLDWVRTMESVGNNATVGGVLKTSQSDASALTDFSAFGGVKDFLPALQGLTLYSQIGQHLNVFVNTLESSKRFHVLQRPYVVAMNHKKATISTGQQLAIPGQTYSNGTTVGNTGTGFISNTQYIPAELKLEIVPHIFDNREVKLEFVQQNLDVSSYTTISGNKVPNLSTQTLSNTVVVPDGATIVLGGLITERDTGNKTGLPFISRVPILKYIFGSTSDSKERRELMIFVQPRIMADGDDMVQRQQEVEEMNQSFPKNKQFADPRGPAPLMPEFQNGKLVPRAQPLDDQSNVPREDVGDRMAKIVPKK